MRRNRYDVIIIGSGIAGLTAACYLSRTGYKVLIVEKEKSNLAEKFVQETGDVNPLPKYFQGQKNIFSRFSWYIFLYVSLCLFLN